jgi:ureidoglycolate dehydrogenase (NAD+)
MNAGANAARYTYENLLVFARQLLESGGFSPQHAAEAAEVLLWANARGMDSHGVLRIPRYVEMVSLGIINANAKPAIAGRHGAMAVLEVDRAPGAAGMRMAMKQAIDIAKVSGVGWCSARNITHAGAIGYYALEAAAAGCIGIVMTASGPLMAYFGAKVSGVSTNPIAIAVPSGSEQPVVLDMSTSIVALGKIMTAKNAGRAIPADWGLDAEGSATTDPAKVKTLQPLGGPKGSGLSLMIEILASILIGNAAIAPALEKKSGSTLNGIALALDISQFGAPDAFYSEVARLVQAIKALPKAAGVMDILMPGERGFKIAEQRMQNGIPVAAGTFAHLSELANRLGVAKPAAIAK